MNIHTNILKFSSRELQLSARQWLPESTKRGAVIFVHGWGDHSGRYQEIGEFLARAGFAAYSLDFEGHGLSPGKRASIANFQHLVDDLSAFVSLTKEKIDKVPLFLCGYSMGGCVCATYLVFSQHAVAGVIFNASALSVSKHISSVKKSLARFLGGAFPDLPLSNLTTGALMSRDPAQIAEYDKDELTYHGKITAGTGRQLLLANERIGVHLDRIMVPLLVLQGANDTLVDPEGGKDVYARSTARDKSIHLYPDALHDLFHESNRQQVFTHLIEWLNERT